jgi:hypothetical protein
VRAKGPPRVVNLPVCVSGTWSHATSAARTNLPICPTTPRPSVSARWASNRKPPSEWAHNQRHGRANLRVSRRWAPIQKPPSDRVHHQRHGSADLRVRPLRVSSAKHRPAGPRTTPTNTCPERAPEISRGSSEATPPDHTRTHAPAPQTGCQNAYLAPTTGAESVRAVTHHVVPCGSPTSPPHATSDRMGRRWKHRTPGSATPPKNSPLLSTLSSLLSRPQAAPISAIALSRTPHGVQVVFGGRCSGGVRFARPPANFCDPYRDRRP